MQQKLQERCILWGRDLSTPQGLELLQHEIRTLPSSFFQKKLLSARAEGQNLLIVCERGGNYRVLSSSYTSDYTAPNHFIQALDEANFAFR